ncbi:MAG TPA: hypothetical protein VFN67_00400 [Polyangiales bacterium]|nr:hypothetical protein [Polyangiales bacterium]
MELDPFEHHRELGGINLQVCRFAIWSAYELKSACFKAFLYDAKSVSVPEEELNLVTSAVDERVQVPREEIMPEVGFYECAQAIVALARVDRLNRHKDLHAGW